MTNPTATPPRVDSSVRVRGPVQGRMRALDGLRGVAMVLVVLSHAWILIPHTEFDSGPTRGLFTAGNFAVTIFFVVGGYLLVRGLLREHDAHGRLAVGRSLFRRVIRVGLPVYVVLIVVLITAALQRTPDHPTTTTRASLWPIASFTWNWFLQSHGGLGRADLGHLWYVSVYVQTMLVLTLLCASMARKRIRLLGVLVAAIVLMTWWKADVVAHESLWVGLLRTTTRGDAMFWGGMVAVAVALLEPVKHRATEAATWLYCSGMLAVAALVVIPSSASAYLGWTGFVACAAAAGVVAGIALLPRATSLTRPVTQWPLEVIGHWSLSIYIWHYPIFFFVSRHTPEWSWPVRTVLAMAVLTVAVAASRRFVEAPVTALVDRLALSTRRRDEDGRAAEADLPAA
jgi:peptidoglycan/LPS O-acetylase OafA/YrhL